MILHALHNASLILMGYYRYELVREGWFRGEEPHIPTLWLVGSGAAALLAMGALHFFARDRVDRPDAIG